MVGNCKRRHIRYNYLPRTIHRFPRTEDQVRKSVFYLTWSAFHLMRGLCLYAQIAEDLIYVIIAEGFMKMYPNERIYPTITMCTMLRMYACNQFYHFFTVRLLAFLTAIQPLIVSWLADPHDRTELIDRVFIRQRVYDFKFLALKRMYSVFPSSVFRTI